MMDNDIQFSWNAGYKAGVRDCQLIIANEIVNLLRYRTSNASASRETLKVVKNAMEEMLKSWEENGK